MWEWSPGERPQRKCNFGATSTEVMAEVKEMEEPRGGGRQDRVKD